MKVQVHQATRSPRIVHLCTRTLPGERHTFRAQANFSGSARTTTASHVHAPAMPGFQRWKRDADSELPPFALGDQTFHTAIMWPWISTTPPIRRRILRCSIVSALNGAAYSNIQHVVVVAPRTAYEMGVGSMLLIGGLGLGQAGRLPQCSEMLLEDVIVWRGCIGWSYAARTPRSARCSFSSRTTKRCPLLPVLFHVWPRLLSMPANALILRLERAAKTARRND